MSADRVSYDNPATCSFNGCKRTTGVQSEEEGRFNIALCDPTTLKGNHFLQFTAALDTSWGDAKRWVEKNCG